LYYKICVKREKKTNNKLRRKKKREGEGKKITSIKKKIGQKGPETKRMRRKKELTGMLALKTAKR